MSVYNRYNRHERGSIRWQDMERVFDSPYYSGNGWYSTFSPKYSVGEWRDPFAANTAYYENQINNSDSGSNIVSNNRQSRNMTNEISQLNVPTKDASRSGIIPAIVGGVAGLAGSLINAGSVSDANQQNYANTQGANAYNVMMQDRQMSYNNYQAELSRDWSEKMYDKSIQNQWDVAEYNSASNQRKRLEEAGLNPLMYMSGGTAGTATSSASTSSGATASISGGSAQSPQPVTPSPFGQGLSMAVHDALQTYLSYRQQKNQNSLTDQQTKLLSQQNQWYGIRQMRELGNIAANTRNLNARTKTENLMRAKNAELVTQNIAMLQKQQEQVVKQTQGLEMDNAMKAIQLQYMPEQMRLLVGQAAADIKLKLAQGELTRRQAAHEIHKQSLTIAQMMATEASAENTRQSTRMMKQQYRYFESAKGYMLERLRLDLQPKNGLDWLFQEKGVDSWRGAAGALLDMVKPF